MAAKTPTKLAHETAGRVVVRYWAAARSAAGVERDVVEITGDTTLDVVLETVRLRHVDRPRFKDVVMVCSILVGDLPVGTTQPDQVVLRAGDTVELLPPFAGG